MFLKLRTKVFRLLFSKPTFRLKFGEKSFYVHGLREEKLQFLPLKYYYDVTVALNPTRAPPSKPSNLGTHEVSKRDLFFIKAANFKLLWRSPGQVVMGGDSYSRSHGFESRHWILVTHFSHLL